MKVRGIVIGLACWGVVIGLLVALGVNLLVAYLAVFGVLCLLPSSINWCARRWSQQRGLPLPFVVSFNFYQPVKHRMVALEGEDAAAQWAVFDLGSYPENRMSAGRCADCGLIEFDLIRQDGSHGIITFFPGTLFRGGWNVGLYLRFLHQPIGRALPHAESSAAA
jgi:hypothetical protein